MKVFFNKITILHVILIWTVVTLLVAGYTQLYEDEAYYWMYSRFLDWGYFDHPPMVAVLIKLGSWIPGELGVRLISVLAVSGALYITYCFSENRDQLLYGLILFSILSITMVGMLSLPDNALVLFTALFFLVYKQYLDNDTAVHALLMGLVVAGLLYSKYHGILIIFFTLISNLRILQRRSIWIVIVVSLLTFLPHVLWQFHNDFPSISYHVGSREKNPWNIGMLLEYVGGQPFYYGPFIGIILFITAFLRTPGNLFERALKFSLIGTLLTFLLVSMRVRVEANWTIMILVPMLPLSMNYLEEHQIWQKWTRILAYPSIILLLFIRLHLLFDLVKLPVDISSQLRGHKTFTKKVLAEAQDLPIVANSFQSASLLSFYSGKIVPALHLNGRKSQFIFWELERDIIGEKVLFVNTHLPGKKIRNASGREYHLTLVDSLPVYKDLVVKPGIEIVESPVNNQLSFTYFITARFTDYPRIQPDNYQTFFFVRIIEEGKEEVLTESRVLLEQRYLSGQVPIKVHLQGPSLAGTYQVLAGVISKNLGTWVESKPVTLEIQ